MLVCKVPSCQNSEKTREEGVMAATSTDNISYRLLERLSNLVICSRCLRKGKITPVPQVISNRHALTNECASCRANHPARAGHRRKLATLLKLRR